VERDGEVSIEVWDEGAGFDPAEATPGFGLVGMRERVELAGGTLQIESHRGGGTRVSATLPARHRSPDPEDAHEADRPQARSA
jgi:signal transduction histidine kinase